MSISERYRRLLAMYGGGGPSAISDMAARLGVTRGYAHRVVTGRVKTPSTLRPDQAIHSIENELALRDARLAIGEIDNPALDTYSGLDVGVKATGLSALLFTYVALNLDPNLSYGVNIRSPEMKTGKFSIYMGVPGYIAAAYLKIFNINYDDALQFNPASDFDIELNLDFHPAYPAYLTLPNRKPNIDLLSLARSQARTIFRVYTRAGMINANSVEPNNRESELDKFSTSKNQRGLMWALTDQIFANEVALFKSKWINYYTVTIKELKSTNHIYVHLFEKPLAYFTRKDNEELFDYMCRLVVAVNWCLYGPFDFPLVKSD